MPVKIISSEFPRGLPNFRHQAILEALLDPVGKVIQKAIEDMLGTEEVYTLSRKYREEKLALRTDPPMKRITGKAEDQPGILSAQMFENITFWLDGDTINIGVDVKKGFTDKGFDYADEFEKRSQFLEKALTKYESNIDIVINDTLDLLINKWIDEAAA